MSNEQPRDASSEAAIPQRNVSAEVVSASSPMDWVFWLVAIALLLLATQINSYLPAYWVSANSVWVRVVVIITCVVVALGLLYATHQGKGFFRLLVDARVELRRVTWPTKQETLSTSWQVLLVIVITSIVLWCFDYAFAWAMKLIIG